MRSVRCCHNVDSQLTAFSDSMLYLLLRDPIALAVAGEVLSLVAYLFLC